MKVFFVCILLAQSAAFIWVLFKVFKETRQMRAWFCQERTRHEELRRKVQAEIDGKPYVPHPKTRAY